MNKHEETTEETEGTEETEETEEVAQAQGPYEGDATESPAETEKPNYYDQYVRLSADFENFRKRTEREKAALLAYGKKEFALKMLPMYEVLLRQQKNVQPFKNEKPSKEVKALQDGMRMILTELDKAFKAEGIKKMDVLKKPYDPATQEVVATIPASKKDDGLVVDEVQMGFYMDGQVLRPARVVVGQSSEEN